MQIRIAIDEDLHALTPLFDDFRKSLGMPSEPDACKEFIQSRLQENDSVIFIAFLVDIPVGFLQLYPSFSSIQLKPIWYFDDLFVVPSYRGRGFAKELINKAKGLADETKVLVVRRDKLASEGVEPIEILA